VPSSANSHGRTIDAPRGGAPPVSQGSHAFYRGTTQRNLYGIPIPCAHSKARPDFGPGDDRAGMWFFVAQADTMHERYFALE
jgi:hypothetical protein